MNGGEHQDHPGNSTRVAYLDRTAFSDITEFLASGEWDHEEVIVDMGDFGIEPCTYVFGPSAVRVVDRVLGLFSGSGGRVREDVGRRKDQSRMD